MLQADGQTDVDRQMKIDSWRQTDVVWQLEDSHMLPDTWRRTDADWLWLTECCSRLTVSDRQMDTDIWKQTVGDRQM